MGKKCFFFPEFIDLFRVFALDGFEAEKFSDFYDEKKNIDPWTKRKLVRSIREDNDFSFISIYDYLVYF